MNPMGMMSGPMVLLPSYGKIYDSAEEALSDWKAGKDFKIIGGPYCSIRDLKYIEDTCSTLWIAWNRIDEVRIL